MHFLLVRWLDFQFSSVLTDVSFCWCALWCVAECGPTSYDHLIIIAVTAQVYLRLCAFHYLSIWNSVPNSTFPFVGYQFRRSLNVPVLLNAAVESFLIVSFISLIRWYSLPVCCQSSWTQKPSRAFQICRGRTLPGSSENHQTWTAPQVTHFIFHL